LIENFETENQRQKSRNYKRIILSVTKASSSLTICEMS